MEKKYRLLITMGNHNGMFFVIWMIIVIILAGLMSRFTQVADVVTAGVIVVLFFIYYVSFGVIFIRQYRRIEHLLYQDCDPESCIKAYRYVLAQTVKIKTPRFHVRWIIHLCRALMADGQFEAALNEMLKHKAYIFEQRGHIWRYLYFNNMFDIYLETAQPEKASEHLESMKNEVRLQKAGSKARIGMERGIVLNECMLRLEHGDTTGAEKILLDTLSRTKSSFVRVETQYSLGKVYAHNGENDKARQALEYVVANGNKLHVVTLAKAALEKMGAAV